MRARWSRDPFEDDCLIDGRSKIEPRLPTPEQFQIHGCEQPAIDLGSMPYTDRKIDIEAAAESIKACRRAGKADPRQPKSIDKWARDRPKFQPGQLGIQKSEIEFGIMDHQAIRTDEAQQLVDDCCKGPLVPQEFRRDPVHVQCIIRHLAPGIDVAVKFPAGRDVVQQLDTGHLDDAMAVARVEPGRFSIEHNLTHLLSDPAKRFTQSFVAGLDPANPRAAVNALQVSVDARRKTCPRAARGADPGPGTNDHGETALFEHNLAH